MNPRGSRRRPRARLVALLLAALCVAFAAGALARGPTRAFALAEVARGALAALGLGEPLGGADQTIWRLRALRALAALAVGATLGLSGALLQGLFRNPLASPGVLGVTSGASLGASLALAALGGFGPVVIKVGGALAPLVVTAGA